MHWTIDILYAFCFTTLTGGLLTVIWSMIGKWLEKAGFLNISYRLMQLIMVFWIVPVSYWTLACWDDLKGRWGGDLFVGTPTIYKIGHIFSWFWILGVLAIIITYLIELIKLIQLRKSAMLCDDWVLRCFYQTIRDLEIEKSVVVRQSYHVSVPQLTGCIRPMVILPVRKYTDTELQVIFLHELTHVKHSDILMKNCAMLIRAIHFMNPIAWWFCRMLDRWSEYACDYEVCRREGGLKQYYTVIVDMMQEISFRESLVSRLIESDQQLIERMEHVNMSYKKRWKSNSIAALLLTGVVVLSGSSVYAASVQSANVVQHINQATEVAIEEPLVQPVLQEYVELETDSNVVETVGETQFLSGNSSFVGFNWTIAKNELIKTSAFQVSAGKNISVSVTNPSGTSIRVGIMKPGGTKTYVTGTDIVAHKFSVGTTGSYRVYVQNMGNSQISVMGSYYVY